MKSLENNEELIRIKMVSDNCRGMNINVTLFIDPFITTLFCRIEKVKYGGFTPTAWRVLSSLHGFTSFLLYKNNMLVPRALEKLLSERITKT